MSWDSSDRREIAELRAMAKLYARRGQSEKARELLQLAAEIEYRLSRFGLPHSNNQAQQKLG
jgi:hypothetical protein